MVLRTVHMSGLVVQEHLIFSNYDKGSVEPLVDLLFACILLFSPLPFSCSPHSVYPKLPHPFAPIDPRSKTALAEGPFVSL
jgi:hypothetical protein